jgi:hypothetical protein
MTSVICFVVGLVAGSVIGYRLRLFFGKISKAADVVKGKQE